jgi:predicted HTH domain antitoxin
MKTLSLDIPDFVDVDLKDVRFMLAAKLYELGKLSLGQAAELVGVSKRTFIEVVGSYGVSVLNYSPEELDRDFISA